MRADRFAITSFADLERVLGTAGIASVDDIICGMFDFDGDVVQVDDGIELVLSRYGSTLEFPFALDDVERAIVDLEAIVETYAEDLL